MITIHPPELILLNDKARLQAKIEGVETDSVLWFETEKKYRNYLTTEKSDAFVVGLLWTGIRNNKDIVVKGSMSEKLYYSLNNHLIPLIASIYKKYNPIRIHCEHLDSKKLKSLHAVGSGLSCGVDSLHAFATHEGDITPPHYKVTHFTNFNVGSNHLTGSGGLMQRKFEGRTEIASACAKELGKPLLIVDSNLSEVMKMDFVHTHTLRNVSAALALQKLFHVYYYASGLQTKFLKFGGDSATYDVISLPLLSTENITFYSAGSNDTRVEKTKLVATMDVSYKYLNVCVHHINNCGMCIKCKRTLLTLDILGVIDKYENIFNLENFNSVKDDYIKLLTDKKPKKPLNIEIYDEMIKTGYLDRWKKSQTSNK
ncbi:hypothetical protein ACNRWW_15945 [Metabacillus sp. HB246100]